MTFKATATQKKALIKSRQNRKAGDILTYDTFRSEIQKARDQVKKGEVVSQEQILEQFGV